MLTPQFNQQKTPQNTIECDMFSGDIKYLSAKDERGPQGGFQNYEEYATTVSVLNACLADNAEHLEGLMNKLGKTCDAKVHVDYGYCPLNPYASIGKQRFGGDQVLTLLEIAEHYKRSGCIELLKGKFSPEKDVSQSNKPS